MQIVVITDEVLKKELLNAGTASSLHCIYVGNIDEMMQHREADAFIDLLFEPDTDRIDELKSLAPKPVIINSVIHTLQELSMDVIRINAWPTFLASDLVEGSASKQQKKMAEEILRQFHKQISWLPDVPGFIGARVVSKIVNEAWLAVEEGVSTPHEIDIAMRLGTNYPYGPLDWAEKIGTLRVKSLLDVITSK
jgi:3-hydroxybutyryl-CoA dehydrogenase